jgi:branched-chain amino acid transport system substrate-binding protein
MAAAATLALVVAACGSDEDDSASAETAASADTTPEDTAPAETTSDDTTPDATTAESDGTTAEASDDPIELVLMWEVKGESDYGIDSMQNAAELAIDQINANGGVDGRMIEATRLPASIVDVQTLTSQFLEAEGMDPDLIIGFVAPTVAALARQVDAAEIPIIGIGAYPLIDGLPVGSDWFFQLQAEGADAAASFVSFAKDSLGATDIAILHTDESYGTESAAAGAAAVEADPDLNLVTNLAHSTTADDFTREVQDAKDADVVINYSYPNPLAAQVQAFDQAGLDIPTISGSSASTAASTSLVTPEQLGNLYGVLNCNPSDDSRQPAADFISAYDEAYGSTPDLIGMVTYDSIYLAAASIAAAGSSDHQAVADSLREINFTEGACAPEWKADAAQIFNHQQVVVSYGADGVATTEESIELPAR